MQASAFRLTLINKALLVCALVLRCKCSAAAAGAALAGEAGGNSLGTDWLRPSYHFTRAKFHMNGARQQARHIACSARLWLLPVLFYSNHVLARHQCKSGLLLTCVFCMVPASLHQTPTDSCGPEIQLQAM